MIKRLAATAALLCTSSATLADSEILEVMNAMQRYTHKLQLSIEAGNQQLAEFYAHELEEQLEELEEIDEYDGHPVGEMGKSMLEPVYEQLEAAVKASDMAAADTRLSTLIETCNQCHQATEHGYVVINRNSANPYAQDFSAKQ